MYIVLLDENELAYLRGLIDSVLATRPRSVRDEYGVASQLDVARRFGKGDGVSYQMDDSGHLSVWDMTEEI